MPRSRGCFDLADAPTSHALYLHSSTPTEPIEAHPNALPTPKQRRKEVFRYFNSTSNYNIFTDANSSWPVGQDLCTLLAACCCDPLWRTGPASSIIQWPITQAQKFYVKKFKNCSKVRPHKHLFSMLNIKNKITPLLLNLTTHVIDYIISAPEKTLIKSGPRPWFDCARTSYRRTRNHIIHKNTGRGNKLYRISTKTERRGWPRPWHYSVKTSYRRNKNKISRKDKIEESSRNTIRSNACQTNITSTNSKFNKKTRLVIRKVDKKSARSGLEPMLGGVGCEGSLPQPLRHYCLSTITQVKSNLCMRPCPCQKNQEVLKGLEHTTAPPPVRGAVTLPLRYTNNTLNRYTNTIIIILNSLTCLQFSIRCPVIGSHGA